MFEDDRIEGVAGGRSILIVDDDRGFREFVRHLLARAGLPAVHAASGEEALRHAASSRPAAVLLDVSLPDIDGFEVCRELRDLYGDALPVIFVSGVRVESHDRTAGLLLGGDDYLIKPVEPDELVARLRRAVTRTQNGSDESRTPDAHTLTAREIEVLGLLAQGLDSAAIAQKLVISPKTVSTHLQRVMAKLGVHSRAHAVARAYQARLIVPDDEPHSPDGNRTAR